MEVKDKEKEEALMKGKQTEDKKTEEAMVKEKTKRLKKDTTCQYVQSR